MAKTCNHCGGTKFAYAGWLVAVYRYYCINCGEWQSSIWPPTQIEIDRGKADRKPKRNADPDKTDDKPE